MLIFVSDLHFTDATVGENQNVSPEAVKGTLSDLTHYCGEPEEVKIVFLGDVFDLIRSTYWLDKPELETPWGDMALHGDSIGRHAETVLDNILRKNARTLDLLREGLSRFPKQLEVIYIPGNHDRLCNIFDSLRVKVRDCLGIAQPLQPTPFPHAYDDLSAGNRFRYGVFARHGHEFELWNYEGTDRYSDADYDQAPIGDPITAMIAARLPVEILKNVDAMASPISQRERDELERNLQEIENVRPITAILQWLFYQVRENPEIRKEIDHAVSTVAEDFNNMHFVRQWYDKHNSWNPFRSRSGNKLKLAIETFKHFNVAGAERLINIIGKCIGSDNTLVGGLDRALVAEAEKFLAPSSRYRYLVMGHTHHPMQVPIRVMADGAGQIYVNTGTWRQRYVQGRKSGFVGIKYLTYTIFYSEKENGNQQFETWTGSLKERGVAPVPPGPVAVVRTAGQ